MSPRRPTAALLIYLHPFLRSHFRHSITTYYFYIAYSYITHMRASWIFCLSRDWRYDHRIFFGTWLPLIYFTRVLDVCEYIQTYSLACPWLLSWPDFLAWRRALRRQPRNLRSIFSSLAKIGVILVSFSCGEWSPIGADEPQTASAINH